MKYLTFYTENDVEIELGSYSNANEAWDHQQLKIDELQEQLKKAKELLENFASMGPKYKTKNTEKACWTCDMGDSGYSSDGEGFHDDSCPIMLAQKFLEK